MVGDACQGVECVVEACMLMGDMHDWGEHLWWWGHA